MDLINHAIVLKFQVFGKDAGLAFGIDQIQTVFGPQGFKAINRGTRLYSKPMVVFVFQAILIMVLRSVVVSSPLANIPFLLVLVALIGANYGANLSVFPVITKDFYGPTNFAINYGIVYTAWGLGGFMISQVGSSFKDLFGDFNNADLMASGILVVAAVMISFIKSPQPQPAETELKAKPISVPAGK